MSHGEADRVAAEPPVSPGTFVIADQYEQGVLAGDTRMLVAGELLDADAMFEVIDPASAHVAGVASDGTVAGLDRGIAAARRRSTPRRGPGMWNFAITA
jgi:hypothetical protein